MLFIMSNYMSSPLLFCSCCLCFRYYLRDKRASVRLHLLDILLSVLLRFTVLLTSFASFNLLLTAIYIYSYLKTVWFCFFSAEMGVHVTSLPPFMSWLGSIGFDYIPTFNFTLDVHIYESCLLVMKNANTLMVNHFIKTNKFLSPQIVEYKQTRYMTLEIQVILLSNAFKCRIFSHSKLSEFYIMVIHIRCQFIFTSFLHI
jgi:hypothetical protein